MKKLLPVLIGLILLNSCVEQNKTDNKVVKMDSRKGNDLVEEFKFTIENLTKDAFDIETRNDTIIYIKKLPEGIDGEKIYFDTTKTAIISAKIKFKFGFLQYTTDDRPPHFLEFSKQSRWSNLEIENGIIEIADFYGNTTHSKVCEVLGFKTNEEIVKSIESESLELIKYESLKLQNHFFKTLLEKRSQYENCCPEYIKQAETFLKSNKADFGSAKELGLELVLKGLTLEINGQLKKGNKFRKVIIEKEQRSQ